MIAYYKVVRYSSHPRCSVYNRHNQTVSHQTQNKHQNIYCRNGTWKLRVSLAKAFWLTSYKRWNKRLLQLSNAGRSFESRAVWSYHRHWCSRPQMTYWNQGNVRRPLSWLKLKSGGVLMHSPSAVAVATLAIRNSDINVYRYVDMCSSIHSLERVNRLSNRFHAWSCDYLVSGSQEFCS